MTVFEPIELKLIGSKKELETLLSIVEFKSKEEEPLVLRLGDFTCCGFTVAPIKQSYIANNHLVIAKIENDIPIYMSTRLMEKKESLERLNSNNTLKISKRNGLFGDYYYFEFV